VHQSNCWDFNPVYEQASQRAEADHTQLADENRRLAERLAVLEAAKPEKTKPRRVGEAE
jgi:hypothetical protein